ncbi:hypothetical protein FRB95_007778 [Tulasnella sp. JGI-2019a]|nr:hypothetical protein FRB93_006344 [Tulasnella sp. JGI-2019a]KAG9027410.1 hypothetical protein FRB95_007778 [Tulasnella sp. JGI-2019a]
MSTATSIGVITLVFLLAMRWYRSVRSRSSIPYPPGPPGDFILGNLRQMSSSYQWLTFADWGRKYGPLTYLNIVGQPFLVINTQKAAVDLLEKKASIYSDRPRLMMVELTGVDGGTAFVPMGPTHRKHRKLLTQALHPRVVERDYVPLQERSVRKLAQFLLDTPDKFVDHIHRAAGETVQVITYGEFSDGHVDFVDLGRENMKNIGQIISGYLVDLLPWLVYLPGWVLGTEFKQEAKHTEAVLRKAQWLPYNMVKSKVCGGTQETTRLGNRLR